MASSLLLTGMNGYSRWIVFTRLSGSQSGMYVGISGGSVGVGVIVAVGSGWNAVGVSSLDGDTVTGVECAGLFVARPGRDVHPARIKQKTAMMVCCKRDRFIKLRALPEMFSFQGNGHAGDYYTPPDQGL